MSEKVKKFYKVNERYDFKEPVFDAKQAQANLETVFTQEPALLAKVNDLVAAVSENMQKKLGNTVSAESIEEKALYVVSERLQCAHVDKSGQFFPMESDKEINNKVSPKIRKLLNDFARDNAADFAQSASAHLQNVAGGFYLHGQGVEKNEQEAVALFKLAEKQGNLQAKHNLGRCYHGGLGVKRNAKEAANWYVEAAQQGNAEAQNSAANCYYYGFGVEENKMAAHGYYLSASLKGHAQAQNNLANCLSEGPWKENKSNQAVIELYGNAKQNAVILYRKAAEQGHGEAQNSLGNCYLNAVGVKKNKKMAVSWFKESAKQGNAEAQNSLGNCYLNAVGVKKNDEKAAFWFQKSAKQGNAEAQNSLGNCYRLGIGVAVDEKKAVENYYLSAQQQNPKAQNNLGDCLRYEIGVPQDLEKAVACYELAAKQKYAEAQNNLGNCYRDGIGVAKDNGKAAKNYLDAALQKDAEGQNNLGNCYRDGKGMPVKPDKAVQYYRLSAAQGYSDAQNNLGDCYRDGKGVGVDETMAVENYALAAEQGHKKAQNTIYQAESSEYAQAQHDLGLLYVSQEKYDKAAEMYQKAAAHGVVEAKNNLGELYYDGLGVAEDTQRACALFKEAAENGLVEAKYNFAYAAYQGMGDQEEGFRYCKEASDDGYVRADVLLGRCYEHGMMGQEQNHLAALTYYHDAALKQDPEGMRAMNQDFEPKLKYMRSMLKDGIIEFITAKIGEPEADGQTDYSKRITNPESSFIGTFVHASKEDLSLSDLLEIEEAFQGLPKTEAPQSKGQYFSAYGSADIIHDMICDKFKTHLREGGLSEENLEKMKLTFDEKGMHCKSKKLFFKSSQDSERENIGQEDDSNDVFSEAVQALTEKGEYQFTPEALAAIKPPQPSFAPRGVLQLHGRSQHSSGMMQL